MMTRHTGHGNDPAFWSNDIFEHYNTIELRGAWAFGKMRLSAQLPYHINSQFINDYKRFTVNGIGDPVLILERRIVELDNEGDVQFNLNLGVGIKGPLGSTTLRVNNETPNLDLQPGSGSWDGMGLLNYTLQLNNIVVEGVNSFRRNGKNNEDYRYGSIMNNRIDLGYRFNIKNSSLIISCGYYNEFSFMDVSDIKHDDTGGEIHYANASIKAFMNDKIQFFADFQYALKNRLNGNVQLITPYRGNIGLLLLIPQQSKEIEVEL